MEFEINKVYSEDCVDTIGRMPDNFIDLVVTSPPYDNLRDYDGFNFDFKKVVLGLYRVMKKGGIVVWVVGDQTINGDESGTSFTQALYFKEIGFKLHDTMIYEKANFGMPSRNRYHQIFEYMFVFSKGKLKTFNPICDRKNKWAGQTCLGENTVREADGSMKPLGYKNIVKEYGMRFNIWRMNTVGQEMCCKKLPHPAMFPKALARDHILSWSNEGDLVYDPFIGSGTTAIEAINLGRNYIGSDISSDYVCLAEKRIRDFLKDKSES
jgi:DNA modification methylase